MDRRRFGKDQAAVRGAFGGSTTTAGVGAFDSPAGVASVIQAVAVARSSECYTDAEDGSRDPDFTTEGPGNRLSALQPGALAG